MNVNVWLDTHKFTLREINDSILLDSKWVGTIRLFVNDSGNIAIEFCVDKTGFQWIISDEGKGFNWNTLPDPTDEKNILELNGRGVYITKFLFDELEYSGNGNIVRVKKYFSK